MSKLEILKNNVIEEVLRERANYYFSKNRANDFWLIESPEFVSQKFLIKEIQQTIFFEKNQASDYFAIISSDKVFINWLALRIGYFESFNTKKQFKNKEYTVNGIRGNLKYANALISLK